MQPHHAIDIPGHVSEILLVRHAHTVRNTLPEVAGFLASPRKLLATEFLANQDAPLSEEGRRQAERLGQALAEHLPAPQGYAAYFDSGYRRAAETLDRILEAFALEPHARGRRHAHLHLRERDPGYPFQMTITEVATYFPWYLGHEATVGPFYARPPGGETVAEVYQRVLHFLDGIQRTYEGQRVFVVAHGHVLRAFRFWLEQVQPARADTAASGAPAQLRRAPVRARDARRRVDVCPGQAEVRCQPTLTRGIEQVLHAHSLADFSREGATFFNQ